MAYILGLVVVALFFTAMHYFTEFSNSQKISITAIVLAIIITAIFYNEYTKSKNRQMLNATLKYKQGKTIRCNGRDVNATNYSLSIGTYTFIGKKNTPNYQEMISASSCE